MCLVDLYVPTSHQSLELNPDLRRLAATQAKRTAASDLRHCATGPGLFLVSHFLVSHFNFSFIPCGRLSWLLLISFLLQVKARL